jgi:hypothetical protein
MQALMESFGLSSNGRTICHLCLIVPPPSTFPSSEALFPPFRPQPLIFLELWRSEEPVLYVSVCVFNKKYSHLSTKV